MSDNYFSDVEMIAEDIFERVEGDIDNAYDAVSEGVDSSQWIIYYNRNEEVLRQSDNEPDGDEVLSMAGEGADWRKIRTVAAFMAMEQDVHEALRKLKDEQEME